MIRLIAIVTLAFMAHVSRAVAQPTQAGPGTVHEVIFLLHGWAGNSETFGKIPELLTTPSPGLWPADHWIVENISFKPPHSDATIQEQVRHCAAQIEDRLAKLEAQFPGESMQFNFITHSMGGLILRNLYLDHPPSSPDPIGRLMAHLSAGILIAPPNMGSDEVLFSLTELRKKISSLVGILLSEEKLTSLTNGVMKRVLKGMPFEQATNMASGSDYIRYLNSRWHDEGACDRFPGWILAGAHDIVVDLANANLNYCHVELDEGGRTRCLCCRMNPDHVRYYPYNHTNTNRRDGIIGSIQDVSHPVFADIARILLERPLDPLTWPETPSKIFLRLEHPAPDTIKRVVIEPFGDILANSSNFPAALAEGRVTAMRRGDFIILAGLPQNLLPLPGDTVLEVRVIAERASTLPTALSYLPGTSSYAAEYGPIDLVSAREVHYRPVQINLPRSALMANSMILLTIPLSEPPVAKGEFNSIWIAGCRPEAPAGIEAWRTEIEQALSRLDSIEIGRYLRKLGATQDPRVLDIIQRFARANVPVPVRRSALAALADLRTPAAFPILEEATGSDDESLRIIAVDGLGRVPHPEAVGRLLKILGDPKGGPLERAALSGICQVPERLLIEGLVSALKASEDTTVRSRLLSLSLVCPIASMHMFRFVAGAVLDSSANSTIPNRYTRLLDRLLENAVPDDRTYMNRIRRDSNPRDPYWNRRALEILADRKPAATETAPDVEAAPSDSDG